MQTLSDSTKETCPTSDAECSGRLAKRAWPDGRSRLSATNRLSVCSRHVHVFIAIMYIGAHQVMIKKQPEFSRIIAYYDRLRLREGLTKVLSILNLNSRGKYTRSGPHISHTGIDKTRRCGDDLTDLALGTEQSFELTRCIVANVEINVLIVWCKDAINP